VTHLTRTRTVLVVLTAVLAFLLATADSGQAQTTRWTVDGYKILLNGQPFFAKGVCYFPLPLGNESGKPPYGDYFYNFPDQDPVWGLYLDRDLPLMRAAGVNLVRLYSMWAWADADFVVSPLNGNKTRTLSHQGFLDLAYNSGTRPMYVLVNVFIESGRWADSAYQAQIEDVYRQLATELKDHPAVMGFMVGNELNAEGTRTNPQFWQWIDRLAGIIKEIAPDKLTTMALVDDGFRSIDGANAHAPGAPANVMPHLDVWGINNYRGRIDIGFTPEFWTDYQAKAKKPLLMTEWGAPASQHVPDAAYPTGVPTELPNRAQDQATYIRNHYNDMVNHSTLNRGVSSGGALFMWADQWDKQGCPTCSPSKQDGTASGPSLEFPGRWHDEEWFGIHSLIKNPTRPLDQNYNLSANQPWPADTLVPRAAYDVIHSLFTKPDAEVLVTTRTTRTTQTAGTAARAQDSANSEVVQATTSDHLEAHISLLAGHFEGLMADWYVGVVVYPHQGADTGAVYYLLQDNGTWAWTPATRPFDLPSRPTHVGPVQQVAHLEIHSGPAAAGYYVLFLALAFDHGEGLEIHADSAEVNVVGR
jgi:hypothetical protein